MAPPKFGTSYVAFTAAGPLKNLIFSESVVRIAMRGHLRWPNLSRMCDQASDNRSWSSFWRSGRATTSTGDEGLDALGIVQELHATMRVIWWLVQTQLLESAIGCESSGKTHRSAKRTHFSLKLSTVLRGPNCPNSPISCSLRQSLSLPSFDVSTRCKYNGTGEVVPCKKHGDAFQLVGCKPATCTSPRKISEDGYVVQLG